jgi:hypothetical protein
LRRSPAMTAKRKIFKSPSVAAETGALPRLPDQKWSGNEPDFMTFVMNNRFYELPRAADPLLERLGAGEGNRNLVPSLVSLGPLAGSMLTILLPRRSVQYSGLAVAAFGAPRSCLPTHPRHRGSRRSEPVVESPWRYNRWVAHRSR